MKKILLSLLMLTSMLLSGCNADPTGLGSFSFHYVHIQMYGMEHPVHYKVKQWTSDNGGIEIKTENYGSMLVGDGFYLMYDIEKCPICGTVNYE